jgi:hypothetical protein
VFFTCKPGTSTEDIAAQIADARALLSRIPTVRTVHTGRRDVDMQRPVSITDFDIGLLVICDHKADYQVYADHPLHMEYIGKHKNIWERLRVMDYET